MGCVTTAICLYFLISLCYGVPPSPTASLMEDINGIKMSLKYFANIAEKWSNMYNTQIEPRIVSTSSALAGIDSNVKNLQERAHVWDTFQLHISAWNDQLSTTDRKLDIISKAQEKLFNLDAKLNYISNLEEKLETMSKKLDKTEENLTAISKKLDHKDNHMDPLFGEFATRGILSTLKLIERKLDKVQLNGQNLIARQLKQNQDAQDRITLICKTPIVEELLHDVASKVDVIFDKFSEKHDFDLDGNEYIDDQQAGSGDSPRDAKQESDVKLLRKILKRLNQPCKQTNSLLEDISSKVKVISSNTDMLVHKNSKAGSKAEKIGDVIQVLDDLVTNMTDSEEKREISLNSHFIEQRSHFEGILKTHLKTHCIHQIHKNKLDAPIIPAEPIDSRYDVDDTALQTTTPAQIINNHTHKSITEPRACSDLPKNSQSGIYDFKTFDRDESNLSYHIRYCEVNSGGVWTVIQRRVNNPGFQNFSLSWSDYKYGFGSKNLDFWIGNEFIHKLSNEKDLILRIELGDFEGNTAWAEYTDFKIASERDNYRLHIGGYRGNASDSFSSHNFSQFSTYDRKNDEAPDCCPCAVSYGGGWWFNSCFEANLNGVYHKDPTANDYYRGIIWENWLGNYSLEKSQMMVRPKTEDEYTFSSSTEDTVRESTLYPYIEDP